MDQEDSNQRDACQRDDKSDESFDQGELRLRQLLVPVAVFVLICLVNLVEQTIMCHCLITDIDDVPDDRDDCYAAGYFDDICLNQVARDDVISVVHQIFGKDGG
jgi:hypothetical protein